MTTASMREHRAMAVEHEGSSTFTPRVGGIAPTATGHQGTGADRPSCESCDGPYARAWSTPQGTGWLCPTCATLHGLGCP